MNCQLNALYLLHSKVFGLKIIKYQVNTEQKVVKSKLAEKLGIIPKTFQRCYGDFVDQATHNLGGICQ